MIAILLKSDVLAKISEKAVKLGRTSETAMVGAQAAANLVRDHLFALDAERPNQLGGPRTHFYANAAKSVTTPEPDGPDATFTITQIGLAQRWLGGEIKPGGGTSSVTGNPTKYLAIPARAEAYGKTPGEFNDLEFRKTATGGLLVESLQTGVSIGRRTRHGRTVTRGNEAGGLVMFWLVTSVNQKPDPTVLPTEQEMGDEAARHMESHLSDFLKS